jgi:hypothetical protein
MFLHELLKYLDPLPFIINEEAFLSSLNLKNSVSKRKKEYPQTSLNRFNFEFKFTLCVDCESPANFTFSITKHILNKKEKEEKG